jgi:hypothetical protein
MLVRFIIQRRDTHSHQKMGVFQVAYEFVDSDEISMEKLCRLKSSLCWFERHLTIPERSKLDPRAIFWFRTAAHECIRRVWSLTRLLEACEVTADMVRTARPGYIVYRDDLQVAAIPFRDTFAIVDR